MPDDIYFPEGIDVHIVEEADVGVHARRKYDEYETQSTIGSAGRSNVTAHTNQTVGQPDHHQLHGAADLAR